MNMNKNTELGVSVVIVTGITHYPLCMRYAVKANLNRENDTRIDGYIQLTVLMFADDTMILSTTKDRLQIPMDHIALLEDKGQ